MAIEEGAYCLSVTVISYMFGREYGRTYLWCAVSLPKACATSGHDPVDLVQCSPSAHNCLDGRDVIWNDRCFKDDT
jgi:hypothetical protein